MLGRADEVSRNDVQVLKVLILCLQQAINNMIMKIFARLLILLLVEEEHFRLLLPIPIPIPIPIHAAVVALKAVVISRSEEIRV